MNEPQKKPNLLCTFLKAYWWAILIILAVPILLNFIVLIPAFLPIAGSGVDWLMFWGTYISAIASFAMVFITWRTLQQNKEQLNELKRQWEEQNQPKVFCSLEKSSADIVLILENISNCAAINISVFIDSNLDNQRLFQQTIDLLNKTYLMIPPLHKKVINLYIPASVTYNYEGKYIEVTISIDRKEQGTYRMFLSEINLIRSIDYSPISDSLKKIDSTIKNKKL